jgi:hypothetical protein
MSTPPPIHLSGHKFGVMLGSIILVLTTFNMRCKMFIMQVDVGCLGSHLTRSGTCDYQEIKDFMLQRLRQSQCEFSRYGKNLGVLDSLVYISFSVASAHLVSYDTHSSCHQMIQDNQCKLMVGVVG